MTTVEMIRQAQSRRAALFAYAMAHDAHATAEQVLVAEGRHEAAQDAHLMALITLRAYRAEMDDPEPIRFSGDGTLL